MVSVYHEGGRHAQRTQRPSGGARTGPSASNGSGDYAIAFSTSPLVRRTWNAKRLTTTELAKPGSYRGSSQPAR